MLVIVIALFAWVWSNNMGGPSAENQAMSDCVANGGVYDVVSSTCKTTHTVTQTTTVKTTTTTTANTTPKAGTVTTVKPITTAVSNAPTSQMMSSFMTGTMVNLPALYETSSSTEIVYIANPGHNSSISTPLTVTGAARGYWYSSTGTFPVILANANGVIIAKGTAQALTTTATNDLVTYTANLIYSFQPSNSQGTLIIKSGGAKDMTASMTVFFQ